MTNSAPGKRIVYDIHRAERTNHLKPSDTNLSTARQGLTDAANSLSHWTTDISGKIAVGWHRTMNTKIPKDILVNLLLGISSFIVFGYTGGAMLREGVTGPTYLWNVGGLMLYGIYCYRMGRRSKR